MADTSKQRLWGGRISGSPSGKILAFLSGRDVSPAPPLDSVLFPHDIAGSIAHAKMLGKQGIISGEELDKILAGLGDILKEGVELSAEQEDVHTAVEKALEARIGEPARVLHTARSRNDQIVLDMRLFLRKEAADYSALLAKAIGALLSKADAEAGSVMPGYTHHRRAMLTTFGEYLFSVATALARDRQRFLQWLALYDNCPLGSAASYGTSFPIDRAAVAAELEFSGPEPSAIDPIQNRWEPEAAFAFAVSAMMGHLASFAQTLILFSAPEFGYVVLPDSFCTGSSIMPQKKNPDFLELLKGKAALCNGYLAGLLAAGSGSFIGYNKDSQVTKQLVIDAILETKPALELLPEFLAGMRADKGKMLSESGKHFIGATHFLEGLVARTGMKFRDAKHLVELAVKTSEEEGADRITASGFLAAGGKELTEEELAELQDPGKIVSKERVEELKRKIAELRKKIYELNSLPEP